MEITMDKILSKINYKACIAGGLIGYLAFTFLAAVSDLLATVAFFALLIAVAVEGVKYVRNNS